MLTMTTVPQIITSRDIIKAIEEGETFDVKTRIEFLQILRNARNICNEQIKENEALWYWNDELYHVNNAIKTLESYEVVCVR